MIGVSEIRISCAGEALEGERIPVGVTVLPENAGNRAYRILVSDPEAGEFRDGWFYARRPGNVTLTAISEDNPACEDTAEVTVKGRKTQRRTGKAEVENLAEMAAARQTAAIQFHMEDMAGLHVEAGRKYSHSGG